MRTMIHPVNLFMYTKINGDGSIIVKCPISKAGNKIILRELLPAVYLKVSVTAGNVLL